MLKGVTTNVLSVDQGAAFDYVVASGFSAPCCFGVRTGLYGEVQFVGTTNIVQEFSGLPYLMLTVEGTDGTAQYRRIPLLPWTPS